MHERRRKNRIEFHLDNEERRRLKALVKLCGFDNRSDFLREVIRSGRVPDARQPERARA
jgi:Arc/MetJ-type ribon-helix-helix transcriptional regulator